MTFEEWQAEVPLEITEDSLWKMRAYQLGLFVSDLCWKDGVLLWKEPRTRAIADQVFRSTANISSNIAEGYSRGTGKDRSRFYDYALGSARESRDWYFKARPVLKPKVIEHRIKLLTEIVKLLVRMSSNERRLNARLTAGETLNVKLQTNH